MLKQWCYAQLELLKDYKHSKEELELKTVQDRLNKSFQTYEKELADSREYLARRNEINLTRKMRRAELERAKKNS